MNNQPKISESEAATFEHTSYVLIARTHHCLTCDAVQNYSDLFEVWTHPTKTATSKAKILKAATTRKLHLQIDYVTNATVDVPVCHECLTWANGLHGFTSPTPVSYASWADTLQRKAQQLIDDRRAAAKKSTEPDLDLL